MMTELFYNVYMHFKLLKDDSHKSKTKSTFEIK